VTVKVSVALLPPLEQPTSPVLPAGVCTRTVKAPAAGIIEDVMVTVSSALLFTEVVREAPLKTTTDVETNLPPVAVRTKLGGKCEKTIVAGEIELRMGTGRALPQSGFSALQPGMNKSKAISELGRAIRRKEGMKTPDLSVWVLCNSRPEKGLRLSVRS
jgi:hypothetical protein